MMTAKVAPKAARMPAAQNTSPHKAGRNKRPPIRSPNASWRGSSIVMYPCCRILLAKNIPPAKFGSKNIARNVVVTAWNEKKIKELIKVWQFVLTENKTKGITKRGLTPDETFGVNGLGGAVDVTPAYPGRCHSKNAYKKTDGPPGQHHLLLGVVAGFFLSGSPYSNT